MEQIAPQNVCNDENNGLIKLNQHHPIHPLCLHFSQDAVGMIELMTSSTISNATPSSMYLLIPGEIEFRTMHAGESVRKRNHFKDSVLRASRHYYQMLMNWVMQQELKAKWFGLLTQLRTNSKVDLLMAKLRAFTIRATGMRYCYWMISRYLARSV